MGRFAVYPYTEGIVCLWCDQDIKKSDSPILLITFNCELYTWIYAVDVIQEKLLVGLLFNDPSVIHKPVPIPGGCEADLSACPSKCSMYRLAYYGAYRWPHGCAFYLFVKLILKGEVGIMQTEPKKFNDILYW